MLSLRVLIRSRSMEDRWAMVSLHGRRLGHYYIWNLNLTILWLFHLMDIFWILLSHLLRDVIRLLPGVMSHFDESEPEIRRGNARLVVWLTSYSIYIVVQEFVASGWWSTINITLMWLFYDCELIIALGVCIVFWALAIMYIFVVLLAIIPIFSSTLLFWRQSFLL